MRHRFNIESTEGEKREVIVDAPNRETAEAALWAAYPGAIIVGYGRWNPEPTETEGAEEAEEVDENGGEE